MRKIITLIAICLTLAGCAGKPVADESIKYNSTSVLTTLFTLPDEQARQIASSQGLDSYEQLISNEQLGNYYLSHLSEMAESIEDICDDDGLESFRNVYFINDLFYCCLVSGDAYPDSIEFTKENDDWYKFTINEVASWSKDGFEINGEIILADGLISNIHVNSGDLMNFFNDDGIRVSY